MQEKSQITQPRQIIAITSVGNIYKSNDTGKSWGSLNIDLQKVLINKSQLQEETISNPIAIYQNPFNLDHMIIFGEKNVTWITKDCGQSFEIILDMEFRNVMFHPYEHQWVLGITQSHQLYYSKDSFVKQKVLIASNVIQFSWGIHGLKNNNNIPQERIIWTENLKPTVQGQPEQGSKKSSNLYLINSFSDSRAIVLNQCFRFKLTEDFLFVPQIKDEEKKSYRMQVTNPNLKVLDFEEGKVDNQDLSQNSYTILDHGWSQLILGINPPKKGSLVNMGDIHLSDEQGLNFNTALKYAVKESNKAFDFTKIFGMEGMYIVNQYDIEKVKQYLEIEKYLGTESEQDFEFTNENIKQQVQDMDTQNVYKLKKEKESELVKSKQTFITYDKGGKWQRLSAPIRDFDQNEINCIHISNQGDGEQNYEDQHSSCYLNLNSYSNESLGVLYSSDNAIGVIIGTGNIGQYLTQLGSETNTYLSRDAGLTWELIFNEPTLYEVGDHGAIIVFAKSQKATQYLYFTLDEGLTLQKVKISDKKVNIEKIQIEPSNTAHTFIIFARMPSAEQSHSQDHQIVIFADFSGVHKRFCKLSDDPSNPESDYEMWTPHAYKGKCILGSEKQFIRKKQQACCYNNVQYMISVNQKSCICTEEDWECDSGYERNKENKCVSMVDEQQKQQQQVILPPDECLDSYNRTQGYRKISRNKCIEGVDHSPIQVKCPLLKRYSFLQNILYVALVSGIVVVIYYLYSSVSNNYNIPQQRPVSSKQRQQEKDRAKIFEQDIEEYEDQLQEEQSGGILQEEQLEEREYQHELQQKQHSNSYSPSFLSGHGLKKYAQEDLI